MKRCKDCIWSRRREWHVDYCGEKYRDNGLADYLIDKNGNNVRVHAGGWGLTPDKCVPYTRKWWKFWRQK